MAEGSMTLEEAKWLVAQELCDDPEANWQHCVVCGHRHWPGRCGGESYEEPCDCAIWFTWTSLEECLAWLWGDGRIVILNLYQGPKRIDLQMLIAPGEVYRSPQPSTLDIAEAVHAAILAVARKEMERCIE